MIPEPTTVASSSAVPTASAASAAREVRSLGVPAHAGRGLRRPDERAHELAVDLRRDRRRRRALRRPGTRARPRPDRRAWARARRPRSRPWRAWRGTRPPRARRRRSRSRARRCAGSPAGTSPRTTTSETAKRPPGRSTRNASAKTRSLSAERLITQFEMITSTESSGSGIASISPLRNSTLSSAGLALVLARERQHLVGHVEAVGLAGRPDAPGREQHVDAAARAEVEHRLAGAELGQRRRVAAAERGRDRRRREPAVSLAVYRSEVIGSAAASPSQQTLSHSTPQPRSRP